MKRADLRPRILVFSVVSFAIATVFLPRIAQDPSYHHFADIDSWGSCPNGWNVFSNIGFVAAGLWGLLRLRTRKQVPAAAWLYFFGVFHTGWGSAYYHWQPDLARLVWDRLPMTLAFSGLLAFLMGILISERLGRRLCLGVTAFGVASVLYWRWTESLGKGDLRPYAFLQFGTLLLIPLVLWLYRERRRHWGLLGSAMGLYVLAKIFETFDHSFYAAFGEVVGGHPLKHFSASAATALLGFWILKSIESNGCPHEKAA